MTTTVTRTMTKRIAASLAAGAALAGSALLTAAPAHAGAYCTVIPHYAPIFEHNDPDSRVVGRIDAGLTVAASRLSDWEMYRVARADNHQYLGYMKPYHLDCSNVG